MIVIGETFSHYRVIEKLGQGGMGEVYLAEDIRLGRKVALKFLAPELARDRESLTRFRNEAKAAAELSHPNIATIYDIGETTDRPYLVLEYLPGQSLKSRIKQGPLPVDEALRIGKALAEGLAVAHAHGIVHRDIKSDNIMLTEGVGVKILDFGLARFRDATQVTRPGTTMGTIHYMSPEQALGKPTDERSDIWSLGIVLYEMLTGQLPFQGEITSVIAQINGVVPQPPTGLRSGIPLELEQAILRCLEKDPGLRYQHADELQATLGRSTGMRQTIPVATTTGKLARWPWIAGTVALIAIATFVTLEFTGGFDEAPPAEALSETVTVEDEFGQTKVQTIVSASYRQRLVIFFADSVEGSDDAEWLKQAFPQLVAIDLSQDPFLVAQTPYYFIELIRREGRPDGLGLSRPLQRKIAREQMATAFVTYALAVEEDGTFVMTQEVHETESGRLLASNTLRDRDLFALADQASVALRTDLKVPEVLAGEYPDLPVSEISTESMEAYRQFTAGSISMALDNDPATAGPQFRAAVEADSTFALAHMSNFVVASVMQDISGMEEAAERTMEYLYRLPPKIQFAMKANYYMNIERDPDKALAVTRMWSQLHPGDEDAFRQLSALHMLRNEREEQVAALEQVLNIDPTDFGTLQSIGTIYREMGRYEDAERWLERFVETYPARASGFIELAGLYVDMGDRARAREELGRALLLDDRSPEAYIALADVDVRDGEAESARGHLEQALNAAGTGLERAEVYDELGDLALREGKIREALEYVESTRTARAEALPPVQVVMSTISDRRLYLLIGEDEEGLARVREDRLSLVPAYRDAAGLGLVPMFVQLGEVDSARVYLEGVSTFVETYGLELIRPVILTFEAMIAELDGDYEVGLDRIDTAIGESTPSGRQLRLRARILRKQGQLKEAERSLDRAALLDPADPVTRIERAHLRLEQSRPADARAELEAALLTWESADADYVRVAEARELLASCP